MPYELGTQKTEYGVNSSGEKVYIWKVWSDVYAPREQYALVGTELQHAQGRESNVVVTSYNPSDIGAVKGSFISEGDERVQRYLIEAQRNQQIATGQITPKYTGTGYETPIFIAEPPMNRVEEVTYRTNLQTGVTEKVPTTYRYYQGKNKVAEVTETSYPVIWSPLRAVDKVALSEHGFTNKQIAEYESQNKRRLGELVYYSQTGKPKPVSISSKGEELDTGFFTKAGKITEASKTYQGIVAPAIQGTSEGLAGINILYQGVTEPVAKALGKVYDVTTGITEQYVYEPLRKGIDKTFPSFLSEPKAVDIIAYEEAPMTATGKPIGNYKGYTKYADAKKIMEKLESNLEKVRTIPTEKVFKTGIDVGTALYFYQRAYDVAPKIVSSYFAYEGGKLGYKSVTDTDLSLPKKVVYLTLSGLMILPAVREWTLFGKEQYLKAKAGFKYVEPTEYYTPEMLKASGEKWARSPSIEAPLKKLKSSITPEGTYIVTHASPKQIGKEGEPFVVKFFGKMDIAKGYSAEDVLKLTGGKSDIIKIGKIAGSKGISEAQKIAQITKLSKGSITYFGETPKEITKIDEWSKLFRFKEDVGQFTSPKGWGETHFLYLPSSQGGYKYGLNILKAQKSFIDELIAKPTTNEYEVLGGTRYPSWVRKGSYKSVYDFQKGLSAQEKELVYSSLKSEKAFLSKGYNPESELIRQLGSESLGAGTKAYTKIEDRVVLIDLEKLPKGVTRTLTTGKATGLVDELGTYKSNIDLGYTFKLRTASGVPTISFIKPTGITMEEEMIKKAVSGGAVKSSLSSTGFKKTSDSFYKPLMKESQKPIVNVFSESYGTPTTYYRDVTSAIAYGLAPKPSRATAPESYIEDNYGMKSVVGSYPVKPSPRKSIISYAPTSAYKGLTSDYFKPVRYTGVTPYVETSPYVSPEPYKETIPYKITDYYKEPKPYKPVQIPLPAFYDAFEKPKPSKETKGKGFKYYTPDFTAKALGLDMEVTNRQAKKLLSNVYSGLEIRKGVIIK